ncbi:MAG: outer membrane beta-barrel protein [Candidatus Sulfotelmatobacter sp.]
MIGKFATASALSLLILTMLLGGQGFAQTTPSGEPPASPTPAAQQPAPPQSSTQPAAPQTSSDQEPATVESSSRRRTKPKDYKNWTYNVGVGANVDSGTTKTFVRGGGPTATAGLARNANKYLGLRADFIFADLPLRQSSLALAQAGSASSYLFALTLDPVINIPVTKEYGGYILFGPGYYHRMGTLSSDSAIPGSACNAFFVWWGVCPNTASIPLSGTFTDSSQNQFGYNVGAGITHKMPSGVEIYAEYRLTHGSGNNTTTDVRPITIGVRW